ncbi:MAG TPA: acyl-CoA dehydratase activase [Pseudobacteroides sp.]|nr:acyl-CoA dehydratase activase [Pseudobacteroides sp.]
MLFVGIDIGASSTDAVLINENKDIIAYNVIHTGANHKIAAEKVLEELCEKSGHGINSIDAIVGTGYGRKNLENITWNITEITCHAKGTNYFFPSVRTILDIGGQDSKAIKIDNYGNVTDFIMNEKCAAGTGRYLEAMARVLEVDIKRMGELSLLSTQNIQISSVCTVFAESEVISKIAEEKKVEDIINGIHNSVCLRAVALLEKIIIEPDIAMTGGVAKNIGIINNLQKMLGFEIKVYKEPQIIGAMGAAIYALEKSIG